MAVYLFPGQGQQGPGYLDELAESVAYREAAKVLQQDLRQLDENSTTAVQLAALIAGVSFIRTTQAKPDAVAGLSVGAFTAAVACGVLEFSDALRLVRIRGEAMQAAFGGRGFGMMAVLGMRESAVRELLAKVRGPLFLASVNAPDEIILSGSDEALNEAAALGGRTRRLNVNVPSHCELMSSVSERLREAVMEVAIKDPAVPYVSNTRARALSNGADVAEDLILNVSRTVRWHESVTLLYELGAREFIEAPPGQALTHLVRREFPDVKAVAAAFLT
jgi:malonate decarboxylase epsilon subunit